MDCLPFSLHSLSVDFPYDRLGEMLFWMKMETFCHSDPSEE